QIDIVDARGIRSAIIAPVTAIVPAHVVILKAAGISRAREVARVFGCQPRGIGTVGGIAAAGVVTIDPVGRGKIGIRVGLRIINKQPGNSVAGIVEVFGLEGVVVG